ncbi:VOC family protein, partial [Cellulosimicrobium sp. CUA-896]|uniref:VOC family protein n=1 Tax=Cellulosimicrobium sp. CUA-896 TaxID=1517881 RepID=UPI00111541C6
MTTTIGRTVLLCRDLDASATFWADGFGFRTLFRGETSGFPLLHVGPGRVDEPPLASSAARPRGPADGHGPALYYAEPNTPSTTRCSCWTPRR